jgi:RNA polymerase sigma-70 factor, ECF subfamily
VDRAFEEFCGNEYARVFRATYAFCGNRQLAEDATQEAFGRALARWRRLRKETWAAGWVMTTAMNVCRNHFRGRRRFTTLERVDRADDSEPSPGRTDLFTALRRLPQRQREALLLHYIGGLPIRAVAENIGMSEAATKSLMWRARKSMRESLRTDAEDLEVRNG